MSELPGGGVGLVGLSTAMVRAHPSPSGGGLQKAPAHARALLKNGLKVSAASTYCPRLCLWLLKATCVEEYPVKHEHLATLSPYQTRHIKRFGDYVFTVTTPEPFHDELVGVLPVEGSAEQVATA